MNDSQELEQLQELIKQFPDQFTIEQVEEANRVARARYEALDNSVIPNLREQLDEDSTSFTSEVCFKLCRYFHYKIFQEITSRAGEFRKSTEPKDGAYILGEYVKQNIEPSFQDPDPIILKKI